VSALPTWAGGRLPAAGACRHAVATSPCPCIARVEHASTRYCRGRICALQDVLIPQGWAPAMVGAGCGRPGRAPKPRCFCFSPSDGWHCRPLRRAVRVGSTFRVADAVAGMGGCGMPRVLRTIACHTGA